MKTTFLIEGRKHELKQFIDNANWQNLWLIGKGTMTMNDDDKDKSIEITLTKGCPTWLEDLHKSDFDIFEQALKEESAKFGLKVKRLNQNTCNTLK